MFRNLKKTLFPGRYYGKQLDRQLAELHKSLDALAAAQGKMAIESTARFRSHLAFLENPAAHTDAGITPTLEFTANDLLVEIEPNGTSKTIVCTIALGDAYRAAVAPCLDSHRAYAQRWDFAHADLSQPPSRLLRHPSWYKIPLVHQLLSRGYERIAYFDADALITKPETPIEPFFAQLANYGRDLLISNDESGANMGVFFARAGATLPVLLDVIWNYHFDPGHVTWEQIAVRTLLDDWPAVASRILVTGQPRDFNSFPEERQAIHKLHHQANTWQPGDFVCHFSGISAPKLTELLALYRQRAGLK
ncbi:MAG TPA: hypothetical protein VHY09_07645 [Candidatus Methylacidiphilales bacterium]|jgi:hypothetical protein|nr:hypothetical protein [Candidatus Methylacidiphilales bacterium]